MECMGGKNRKSIRFVINRGDPSGDYTGQADIDGEARVLYGQVDIGADEVYPAAGDFEPDEDIDLTDFALFVGQWPNSPCSGPDWCGNADFNTSSEVNLEDFVIFASH